MLGPITNMGPEAQKAGRSIRRDRPLFGFQSIKPRCSKAEKKKCRDMVEQFTNILVWTFADTDDPDGYESEHVEDRSFGFTSLVNDRTSVDFVRTVLQVSHFRDLILGNTSTSERQVERMLVRVQAADTVSKTPVTCHRKQLQADIGHIDDARVVCKFTPSSSMPGQVWCRKAGINIQQHGLWYHRLLQDLQEEMKKSPSGPTADIGARFSYEPVWGFQ
jgi:hypothetical protein